MASQPHICSLGHTISRKSFAAILYFVLFTFTSRRTANASFPFFLLSVYVKDSKPNESRQYNHANYICNRAIHNKLLICQICTCDPVCMLIQLILKHHAPLVRLDAVSNNSCKHCYKYESCNKSRSDLPSRNKRANLIYHKTNRKSR